MIENPGEGNDAIYTRVDYTLPANVEFLVAQGTANLQLGGSATENTIYGNIGNNVIDGGGGADVLFGGAGNDTFVFTSGEAGGDTVLDFVGNNGAGDLFEFHGFGTAANGATFTQFNATQWQIHSGLDSHNEYIFLANNAAVAANDFQFT